METTDPQWQALGFCSRCGHALSRRVAHGRERPACPACGFVVYLDPKVACAVLVEHAGKVLLVQRRFEPGRGKWCLPAGFEDADESPQQAAVREAKEETGLDVVPGTVLGVYHYTDDPRGAGVLIVFRAACGAGAQPHASDDAAQVGFFSPDALPPISHHTHAAALADWQTAKEGDQAATS